MAVEDDLLARLRKIEALMAGAGTAGEREAAGAALERVKARLAEQARRDPPIRTTVTTMLRLDEEVSYSGCTKRSDVGIYA